MRVGNGYVIDCANPINRNHYFASGLVARYQAIPGLMGGEKLYDLVSLPGELSQGNHGTLAGFGASGGWGGSTRPGGFGQITYDGSATYVDCGTPSPLDITGNITIFAWIRRTASPAAIMDVSGKGFDGTKTQWELLCDNTKAYKMTFQSFSAGATHGITSATATVLNTWEHWFGIYSVPSLLWIVGRNGLVDAQIGSAGIGLVHTAQKATIGCVMSSGSPIRPWNGQIDGVAIYNRVFSAPELKDYYEMELAGCPGLLNRISRLSYPSLAVGTPILRGGILNSRIIQGAA